MSSSESPKQSLVDRIARLASYRMEENSYIILEKQVQVSVGQDILDEVSAGSVRTFYQASYMAMELLADSVYSGNMGINISETEGLICQAVNDYFNSQYEKAITSINQVMHGIIPAAAEADNIVSNVFYDLCLSITSECLRTESVQNLNAALKGPQKDLSSVLPIVGIAFYLRDKYLDSMWSVQGQYHQEEYSAHPLKEQINPLISLYHNWSYFAKGLVESYRPFFKDSDNLARWIYNSYSNFRTNNFTAENEDPSIQLREYAETVNPVYRPIIKVVCAAISQMYSLPKEMNSLINSQ